VRTVEFETGQLAMLVSSRDARRFQQGLSPRPELAVATGYAAVVDAASAVTRLRDGFPSCTFAQRAYIYWGLNHQIPHLTLDRRNRGSFCGTLASLAGRTLRLRLRASCVCPYTIRLFRLCTLRAVSRKLQTVAGCVHPVKDRGVLWRAEENCISAAAMPLLSARFKTGGLETGFRRGFSQLTFTKDGGEYVAVRFPTQLQPFFVPARAGNE
jgi:hypothetical protein